MRLDEWLQVVLDEAREEVLQLGAAEVLDDLLPVGRVGVAPEVRLQLAGEDLQRRRLADAVRAHEPEHLAAPRRRQSAVRTITKNSQILRNWRETIKNEAINPKVWDLNANIIRIYMYINNVIKGQIMKLYFQILIYIETVICMKLFIEFYNCLLCIRSIFETFYKKY